MGAMNPRTRKPRRPWLMSQLRAKIAALPWGPAEWATTSLERQQVVEDAERVIRRSRGH
jgi:hypothetical protein